MSSAMARPSASCSAVSKLSARRCWLSGRMRRRSMTTSRSCFSVFFSAGSCSISCSWPSTRSRTKPCACRLASSSSKLPLRARAMGASTARRASAGQASTASTIWPTLCACSGSPWSGQ
ncbi:Uncharacterised protein [Bordetella pertussis]|nr:Uncharacterised protein [Bordetella pertussis]